ncbi:hypothetical protein PV729_04310 [Streptomyces europaeiscabiei]|uniref:Integrase n=1 Tax=Streptomyces europaeiscabiei TaxID=146819 RepID=A0ABU4N651_9ACTN|nr:hypothetical protein [Streptomyces europaeiscabiei]MDX3551001.1 hypothetical protein [Streptomyces europaeiscabiei]MDX3698439.1 hypothetical protein [Streptomyces europaeiscabiei]
MARNHANNGRIYRAVITTTHLDGSHRSTRVRGPYDSPSPAKAWITRAKNDAKASLGKYRDPDFAHTAEGHIESAEVIWMKEGSA